MVETLVTPQGREIAYNLSTGDGPAVVFLGGFKSNMAGSKAVFLEERAIETNRKFLRFDYSGHGESSGAFDEGCIGDWYEDACAALTLIDGPVVLVGSSMGGWISLLIAREMPERVAGLVGIAAAPDFTEDGFWAGFDEIMQAKLMREGRVVLPSDYDEPYIITKRLIEDGRERLVLRKPLPLPFAVRFLIGTADTSVSTDVALRLLGHVESPDMRLTLVDGADHSFSSEVCLPMIVAAIDEVSAPAAVGEGG